MPTGRTKFLYPSGSTPLEGYTIKRGIGVGGFGEVYFALSDAGKEVALKRILRNLDIELRGVRQCLNLKHVNLISLWDIRTNEAEESWVVMEYVPGKSLREMLEIYPQGLPEDQVKTWFASIAAGVAYLHEKGIVHRDLKPGNIFCDDDEQVIKIGDYGLSKFISCSRRSGQTESVGTFHYMAPEIGKGEYGKEIDIYAMGIILFELLTGDTPYNGESSQEIIMKHLTATPDLSLVPAQFRPAIEKCLLKDPDERYSTVPEMLVDLPWPDLASNSEKIVTRHSIGPIGTNPSLAAARSDSPAREEPAPETPDANQPMLLRHEFNSQPGADIIFGEVHLSSPELSSPGTRPADLTGHDDQTGQANQTDIVDDIEIVSENRNRHPRTTVGHERPLNVVEEYVTKSWWQGNLPTPLKIALLVIAAIACVLNAQLILPIALLAAAVYLLNYVWQAIIDRPKPENAQAAEVAQAKAKSKQQLDAKLRKQLSLKDFGDNSAELLGGALISTVASIVICSLGFLTTESLTDLSIESIAIFVWMVLVSSAASLALLGSGKLWESRSGAAWKRQLLITAIGALLGGFSYGVAVSLQIDMADIHTNDTFLGSNALPQFQIATLPAYLIFFTATFGILRWWKQVDPIRPVRVSLRTVGLCCVWSVVLSQLLGFNPVWHSIIALATTVSIQIAAPWLNSTFRHKVQHSNAI